MNKFIIVISSILLNACSIYSHSTMLNTSKYSYLSGCLESVNLRKVNDEERIKECEKQADDFKEVIDWAL